MLNPSKLYPGAKLTPKQQEVRTLALNSFEHFIRLVAPYQLLGACHVDLTKWVQLHNEENKLVLWPRDHGKSRMSAFYTCWEIVKDPAVTIIYASATAEKAEEQLRFIRNILTSKIMQRYFPNLIHPQEGQREEWNRRSMVVDHPYRKMEGVVDSTVMTAGIGKTITGKHCKRLVLDDIVVPENNTEIGRKEVNSWVAQAASIMSADSSMFVVGTRYHPRDAYQIMMDMQADYGEDEEGESLDSEPLFVVSQRDVEADGEFLWPRHQRKDGKWFGFSPRILARKRAVYEAAGELVQFFAQYYNNPNDSSTAPISPDLFKYYEKSDLTYSYGAWEIDGEPLYVYAAVDLATSIEANADYTVCMIGGIDRAGNRYVMDIKRYKTNKISKTLATLKELYEKYNFKKLRIESVAGFKLVAEDLADNLARAGVRIPVDFYLPAPNISKEMRVNGILEPLYQSSSVYHYRGGHCQVLEEELISINPAHDDVKDAWAMCCDQMEIPMQHKMRKKTNVVKFHPRFGGLL